MIGVGRTAWILDLGVEVAKNYAHGVDVGRQAHVKPGTRRVLFWLFIIFVVFMIANEPDTSASWVNQGFDWISQAVDGLFEFFDALVT
jgi:hypothetical protein